MKSLIKEGNWLVIPEVCILSVDVIHYSLSAVIVGVSLQLFKSGKKSLLINTSLLRCGNKFCEKKNRGGAGIRRQTLGVCNAIQKCRNLCQAACMNINVRGRWVFFFFGRLCCSIFYKSLSDMGYTGCFYLEVFKNVLVKITDEAYFELNLFTKLE